MIIGRSPFEKRALLEIGELLKSGGDPENSFPPNIVQALVEDGIIQQRRSLTPESVRNLDVGKYFYLMEYRKHYADLLEGVGEAGIPRIIAELFFFRAWTTQFGFRIFSSHQGLSERVLREVANQGNTLGVGILRTQGVNVEEVLGGGFGDLLEERWGEYDQSVIDHRAEVSIPTRQICGRVLERCGVVDLAKSVWLCADFLRQMEEIKQDSLAKGLLS